MAAPNPPPQGPAGPNQNNFEGWVDMNGNGYPYLEELNAAEGCPCSPCTQARAPLFPGDGRAPCEWVTALRRGHATHAQEVHCITDPDSVYIMSRDLSSIDTDYHPIEIAAHLRRLTELRVTTLCPEFRRRLEGPRLVCLATFGIPYMVPLTEHDFRRRVVGPLEVQLGIMARDPWRGPEYTYALQEDLNLARFLLGESTRVPSLPSTYDWVIDRGHAGPYFFTTVLKNPRLLFRHQ